MNGKYELDEKTMYDVLHHISEIEHHLSRLNTKLRESCIKKSRKEFENGNA